MAGIGDFFLGKGAQEKTRQIYEPQQEALLNQILGSLSSPMGSGIQNLQNILGGDQSSFDDFQRPARRGFEQEILPSIAERFTSSFGEGSDRSSAFGQALGTAGRELEEDLFSKRMGMQSDAMSQLMQLLGPAISPRKYQYTVDRQPGFLENVGASAAEGLGKSIGGGLPGAAMGVLSKLFKKN
jgi:hypothetical protein